MPASEQQILETVRSRVLANPQAVEMFSALEDYFRGQGTQPRLAAQNIPEFARADAKKQSVAVNPHARPQDVARELSVLAGDALQEQYLQASRTHQYEQFRAAYDSLGLGKLPGLQQETGPKTVEFAKAVEELIAGNQEARTQQLVTDFLTLLKTAPTKKAK